MVNLAAQISRSAKFAFLWDQSLNLNSKMSNLVNVAEKKCTILFYDQMPVGFCFIHILFVFIFSPLILSN